MARNVVALAETIKLLAISLDKDASEHNVVGKATLNSMDSAVAKSIAKLQRSELIHFSKLLKTIALVKPKNFFGFEEPAYLESWIRMFDKIFKALECPEHMKVISASFYLNDTADA